MTTLNAVSETKAAIPTPPGYWVDAKGKLTHESLIRDMDKERDRLVKELFSRAQEVSNILAEFKKQAFGDIEAFVALSLEQYKVDVGGKKGNVTLYSYDGKFKIIRAIQDSMKFDERILAAKELIYQCVTDWTVGARPEAKAIIDHAFKTDNDGNLSVSRILSLRKLDIKDPRWVSAMDAIGESLQVVSSKSYVRVYERIGETDMYRQVPLDLAAVHL
jgi:hypothetical protein